MVGGRPAEHRNSSTAVVQQAGFSMAQGEGWGGVFLLVETRGIEPLTPALQRRCSAN